MARIVIFSSYVAAGHVGLSAAGPALEALGHEVIGIPSIVLSNHPGWPHVAGAAVPPAQVRDMIDALVANDWFGPIDAVLTGYLPTFDHVALATEVVRNLGVRTVVDPVIGDDPKGLYLDPAAAEAIKGQLLPLADLVTPNRFELAWLTGRPVRDPDEGAAAMAALGCDCVLTSAPFPDKTGVMARIGGETIAHRVERRAGVPHGVGDVLAGLLAAGAGVGTALGQLQALIQASLTQPHLAIAQAAPDWTGASPISACEDI